MGTSLRLPFTVVVGLILVSVTACARRPYHPRGDVHPDPEPYVDEPQISRGEPNAVADSLGHYVFSLPEKLILWNWKMGNHDISPETEEILRDYLEKNELRAVKVRLNEYAPLSEFTRLTENGAVGPGWRYTFGLVTWILYTVLPGRIFGGDAYNPYTNSIYLYSDLAPVALHEGGHAKDTAGRKWKGSRAALRILPIFPLFDEARASNDALGYMADRGDTELFRSGYKLLHPAYGTYVAGEAFGGLPVLGPVVGILGAIPGHISGRSKASTIEDPPSELRASETPGIAQPESADGTPAPSR